MAGARIFIDSDTDAFARKHRWTDDLLIKAVDDVENGLNDGALGASIYKRRVARDGAGSSSGYRIIIVLRVGDRAFVVDAFAKNVKPTHSPQEVRALKFLANTLLSMSESSLALAIKAGDFREIHRPE